MHSRLLFASGREDGAIVAALAARGLEAVPASSANSALERLDEGGFGAVVADLEAEDGAADFELCHTLASRHPEIAVVAITPEPKMETAISAMRAGVHDLLTKPIDVDELTVVVEAALRRATLRDRVKRLRESSGAVAGEGILGDSPAIERMLEIVDRVARGETAVLVTGESGTGKELVARALHVRSGREGPFVGLNCAAMPEALLESELFGHVRGAFTDAHSARRGLFVKAEGGTLFLDEIGEMPLGMQSKLLRVLQERTVRPVGGDTEVPVSTRIIAATHRDLERDIAEHRFREDLYYRINVVRLDVPPLRARDGDVLVLAQRFLERSASQMRRPVVGLTTAAAERLVAYTWPGNVRELQNCIERAVALAQFDRIGESDLPERLMRATEGGASSLGGAASEAWDPSELVPIDELERRYVLRVLGRVQGNKTMAAQILGFDRRTLYRRLRRWGLGDEALRLAIAGSEDGARPGGA